MSKFHDNVIDLETREKLPASYSPRPNPHVYAIIEMLGQRKHQIQDIAVVFVEKNGLPKICTSPMLDSNLCWMGALLQQYAMQEDEIIDDGVDNDGADKDNE